MPSGRIVNRRAFVEHLGLLMDRAGISHRYLAQKISVKPQAVDQWFRQRTYPAPKTVDAIVVFLLTNTKAKRYLRSELESPRYAADLLELGGGALEDERLNSLLTDISADGVDGDWSAPSVTDQLVDQQPVHRLLGRDAELARAVELLTAQRAFREPEVKLLILAGMAGIGKKALAVAIACDKVIRKRFSDGAIVVDMRLESDIAATQERVAAMLGRAHNEAEPAAIWLRTRLGGDHRRVLLVLLNVRPGTGFERLMLGGRQCQTLVATEVRTLGALHRRAEVLQLGPLDDQCVLELLEEGAQREFGDDEAHLVSPVLDYIGGNPFAARLAAAAIGERGLVQVSARLADRSEVTCLVGDPRRLGVLAVPGPDSRSRGVQEVFEPSYADLPDEHQECFRKIGNLIGDFTHVGVPLLADVWDLDDLEAQAMSQHLFDWSLLDKTGADRYSIHPLLLDFAAAKLQEDGGADEDGAWVLRLESRGSVRRRPLEVAESTDPNGTPSHQQTLPRVSLDVIIDALDAQGGPKMLKRWRGARLPAEVWAEMWLKHLNWRRNIRLCWRLMGVSALGTAALIGIGAAVGPLPEGSTVVTEPWNLADILVAAGLGSPTALPVIALRIIVSDIIGQVRLISTPANLAKAHLGIQ